MNIQSIEIWQVIELNTNYEVSTFGRVRNISTGEILQGSLTPKGGYVRVSLGKKHHRVHRLVALAFIPNPNNYPQVHHKDEDKTNNHVDNLEWMLNKDNNSSANKNTKKPKAKSIPYKKREVRFILKNKGVKTAPELARKYNRQIDSISKVWRGDGKKNSIWRRQYLNSNPENKHLFKDVEVQEYI